jgi:3-deoxy-D-manno-oct-2-ulosonic acid (Kdo) hydroxylase
MVSTFTIEQLRTIGPRTLSDELERGRIVSFPESPVPLPSEADMKFLREEMPRVIKLKNVSYHPEAGKIAGLNGTSETTERVTRILQEHSLHVQNFLRRAMPELTEHWTVGTSSFRPLEEQGRNLDAHASNELVHVDAGAYGATQGNRILRFFININPTKDRVWITKGNFSELYRRYGEAAGIAAHSPRTLAKSAFNQIYSGVLTAAEKAGFSRAPLIDTSPYDRLMRRFHNYMKDTPEFQNAKDGHQEFHFKPFSAWMVFTDGVSHACIEGQFALVDTFIIPLANAGHPELAPINVLKFPAGIHHH